MDGVCVLCTLSITAIAWKDVAPVSPHEDIVCFFDSYGRGYLDAPQVTYDTTLYITQITLFVQPVKRELSNYGLLRQIYLQSINARFTQSPTLFTSKRSTSRTLMFMFHLHAVSRSSTARQISTFQQTSKTSFEFFRSLDLWRVSIDEAYVESRNVSPCQIPATYEVMAFENTLRQIVCGVSTARFSVPHPIIPSVSWLTLCYEGPLTTWLSGNTWLLVHGTVVLFVALNSWRSSVDVFAADTKVLKVSLFPIDAAQRQVISMSADLGTRSSRCAHRGYNQAIPDTTH
ncbi:uncharacterized protein F5891DRAFT_1223931 [Suillus fuscotomentosus]|uniref:Uncharacterized protein n=1 Tax=Suillus fuscotomentosus TaxID=1912939 RepID=A0AAD4E7X9_9AGAM|nr:uncharacterized protein F5891DRAFT_1223931 [Suillus fuscotomentosus]KAG1901220.1 hypothetical protein F5891DRAFT_1223931 [Suillus fuscotomentosus]